MYVYYVALEFICLLLEDRSIGNNRAIDEYASDYRHDTGFWANDF